MSETEKAVLRAWETAEAVRRMLAEPLALPQRMALDRMHQRAMGRWESAVDLLTEETVERMSG